MIGERINLLAEKTVALLLAANRRIQFLCRDTKNGGWDRMMFHELSYGKVAMNGCPELAQRITVLLSGFGCKVAAGDGEDEFWGVAADADYVINLDSSVAVDSSFISKLRDGAVVVDAAGAVCDEAAVLAALETGKLAVFASCAENSKANTQLNALKNYLAFPELGEEMRG